MIRLYQTTKEILDKIGSKNESYDSIIKNLIIKVQKTNQIDNKYNYPIKEITNFYEWAKKHKFLLRFWIYCSECQKRRAIELHHIDKNRKHNGFENIELLCKRCHLKKHYKIDDSNRKYAKGK